MALHYKQSAEILRKLEGRRGGIKSLVFNSQAKNKRLIFAVVSQTLKYAPTLEDLVGAVVARGHDSRSGILAPQSKIKWLVRVMLYDMLFSRRRKMSGGGKLKRQLELLRPHFEAALAARMRDSGVKDRKNLLPEELRGNKSGVSLPRYARVNTLKTTMAEAAAQVDLTSEVDPHVRNLLRFASGVDLHDHDLVQSGHLILQDKSSCFPAQILADALLPAGAGAGAGATAEPFDVLDACAAPGNKTSHLAAALGGAVRRVHAIDKSKPRLATLQRRMSQAGATAVQPHLKSFLDLDPADSEFSSVRGILLDPSCSGSGMASRLEHFLDSKSASSSGDGQEERLRSLADFQKQALLHAFAFPGVDAVSYSTCSIHKEENEQVVAHVLAQPAGQNFELQRVLETWPRRGMVVPGIDELQAKCMVRAQAPDDETNGFFVALFRRKREMTMEERARRALRNAKRNAKRKARRKRKRAAEKRKVQEAAADASVGAGSDAGAAASTGVPAPEEGTPVSKKLRATA